MRCVVNRFGRVAVLNQFIGLAVVLVGIRIRNRIYIKSGRFVALSLMPGHNDLDFLGIGVIRHPVIRSVRIRPFCNGEVVGSRTIQRHFIEAAVYTLFICCIGGSGRNGQSQCFNGILRQRFCVQLFERIAQVLGRQLKVKLELELLRGIAGQQLFNIQLNLYAALVGDFDFVQFGCLFLMRNLQHEGRLITIEDTRLSVSSFIRVGSNGHIRIETFGSFGFFDHVFLPPVETGDVDLAIGICDQFGHAAAAIKLVNIYAIYKFKCAQCSAGGRCIFIEGPEDLELCPFNRGIVFCRHLGDFKVALHHQTNILALVNLLGEQDEERSCIKAACAGSCKEVAVLRVRVVRIVCNISRVIRLVVLIAPQCELEYICQARRDAGMQGVVCRVFTLQRVRIQYAVIGIAVMVIQRAAIDIQRGNKIIILEVIDRLSVVICILTRELGNIHICYRGAVTIIRHRGAEAVNQVLDNRIITVISAVPGFLLMVPVLINPQVAGDLYGAAHDCVIHGITLLRCTESDISHKEIVARVLIGCAFEHTVRHLRHLVFIGDGDGALGCHFNAGIQQKHKRVDCLFVRGHSGLPCAWQTAGIAGDDIITGHFRHKYGHRVREFRLRNSRVCAIPHGVFVSAIGRAVYFNPDNVIKDGRPHRIRNTSISGLGDDITNHITSVGLITAVIDRQLPPNPARNSLCIVQIAGGGAKEARLRMVTGILITPDALPKRSSRLRIQLNRSMCTEEYVIFSDLILTEHSVQTEAILSAFAFYQQIGQIACTVECVATGISIIFQRRREFAGICILEGEAVAIGVFGCMEGMFRRGKEYEVIQELDPGRTSALRAEIRFGVFRYIRLDHHIHSVMGLQCAGNLHNDSCFRCTVGADGVTLIVNAYYNSRIANKILHFTIILDECRTGRSAGRQGEIAVIGYTGRQHVQDHGIHKVYV